jgi:hypothetical protein
MVSEKEWQAQVVRLAKLTRWHVYHTFDSRHSEQGYPDLTLIRKGDGGRNVPAHARTRILLVELKTQRGHLSPRQREWLGLLSGNDGVEVFVWRPSDWDQIVEVLQ